MFSLKLKAKLFINMINNQITILKRIFYPNDVRNVKLRDVLGAIRTGNFFGQDLTGITFRIQSEQDHNRQNELKYWNLPVALFNGSFGYKNNQSLIGYSNFTAIDFDGFHRIEDMVKAKELICQKHYVYSLFTTPSGRGLKAIVIHDNQSPDCHEELYEQLLTEFNIKQADSSVSDLSRGNYICYDPNIWFNPNCVPYHFVHNPLYVAKAKQVSPSSKAGTAQDLRMLKWILSLKKPVGNKSDESIIAILNSCWEKKTERWIIGNRANSVFSSASELCNAGVNINKAMNYLVKSYTETGLAEDEIIYQAFRGYQNNAATYGSKRMRFDGYGRKRL